MSNPVEPLPPLRFALVGAAGFVAPRHMEAIKQVGGKLVAALDPHDAVGVLDRYGHHSTEFFTDEYRFERWLEKERLAGTGVDWVVVCSPNYMHDHHIRMGLWAGAKVLCEKPLTINPDNLDRLAQLEREFVETQRFEDRRVFTILQLRHAPRLQALWAVCHRADHRLDVKLRYVTPRGAWYQRSWKGDPDKSGGVITNIGIHMFDVLLWLFGSGHVEVAHLESATHARGRLHLERANVEWMLSTDPADSPDGHKAERWIEIDGQRTAFEGFESLHTTVYEKTLAGCGQGIVEARPALELVARMRGIADED